VPPQKRFEFFVDFEFFSSINVDFERQWPTLDGCEMIFMIGVGWVEEGTWHEQQFIAARESHVAERELLERFASFIVEQTDGAFDKATTAIYHWTPAECSQLAGAVRRHALPPNHMLGQLPWVDLCAICETNACAVPGAWSYGLKKVAHALAQLDPALDPQWPNGLGDGLAAQVMGWHAYRNPKPLDTPEMQMLGEYLSADCRALWKVLTWMCT
jgi:predicted RecB family nuclease